MNQTSPTTCPYCEHLLPPGSLVCPNCNRWLERRPADQAKPAPGQKSPVDETKKFNQQTLKILIPLVVGLGIICIVTGTLGGNWLLTQRKISAATQQEEQLKVASVRTATAQAVSTNAVRLTQEAEATQIATVTQGAATQAAAATQTAAMQAAEATHAAATRAVLTTQTAEKIAALRQQVENWEITFQDDFDTDDGIWYTGEQEDELVSGSWRITDQRYLIDLEAINSFSQWMWPDQVENLGDFYLSASLEFLESSEGMDGGLIFRLQGETQYYLFDIYPSGYYAIYMYTGEDWEAILIQSQTTAFLPNAANLVEIIGMGDTFYLFLNGSLLVEFSDDRLASGGVGMLVGLATAGDHGRWAFDDFVVRAPVIGQK